MKASSQEFENNHVSLLCCNIETKSIELKIRSCRHFKEISKFFNLIMVAVTILSHTIKKNVKTEIPCNHGKKEKKKEKKNQDAISDQGLLRFFETL